MSTGRAVAGVLASLLIPAALSSCSAVDLTESDGPAQEDILADGVVSDAEYRLVVEAQAACVEAAGWQTSEIRRAPDGVLLDFGIDLPANSDPSSDPDVLDDASAASDRCYGIHRGDVERVYFQSKIPTGAERDALFDDLLECLGEADVVGLSRGNTEQEIVSAIREQHPDSMEAGLFCVGNFPQVFPEGMFPE